MITVTHISKKYNHIVLDNISFTINRGDICCILGKQNTGKSTLLKIITGEAKPDSGAIIINKTPLRRNTNSLHDKIGIVKQTDKLISQFTGYQFLEFRSLIYNIPKQAASERIKELTEYFFEDTSILNKFPITFSAAVEMKLKIIASLLHNPDILIMDEPFTKINPAAAEKLIEILEELNRKSNCTILIAAKDLAYIEAISTHIYILNNSKIVPSENLANQ